MHAVTTILILSLVMAFAVSSCAPSEPNVLGTLGTVDVTIKGQPFKLWLADDDDERERGLMFITSEQMAPLANGTKRGMIFIFDHEQFLSFWMKNTIIPLDIAYLDADGAVVTTYTMAPLDTRSGRYMSRAPSLYAIEVNADVWKQLDLRDDDKIELPESVTKPPAAP